MKKQNKHMNQKKTPNNKKHPLPLQASGDIWRENKPSCSCEAPSCAKSAVPEHIAWTQQTHF